jgi:hypothetical protein
MADQKYDASRKLPWEPTLKFLAKYSENASVDRVFVERHTKDRSTSFPRGASLTVRETRYQVGTIHPKFPHTYLADAYIAGADEKSEDWVLIYKVDMRAYCLAAGLQWPSVVSKDNTVIADMWGRGNTDVTWKFNVMRPDNYASPNLNSVHPWISNAYFVGETIERDGQDATVTRRYMRLGLLTDWEFDPETRAPIRTDRQIVPGMAQPGAPARGQQISQRALGDAFSMRTTRTIANGGVPGSYRRGALMYFTFPRLLTSVETITSASDVRFWHRYRSPIHKQVSARIEVDFHFTMPSRSPDLLQLLPEPFDYPGVLFNLNLLSALRDYRIYQKRVGNFVEGYGVPATTPSRSSYLAMRGQERLVGEQIHDWRFGILRRSRFYVVIE